MTTSAEIVNAALRLEPEERAEVARQILLSLEPATADVEVDLAWAEEIRRRLQAIRSGTVKLREWDDVLADAERAISSRRKTC